MSIAVSYITGMIFSGPLSILSGFITYFIQSAIISNYLYLLFNVINYDRLRLNDFKQGFMYFLWKVYGVLFIFYLARLLLSLVADVLGTGAYILNIIIGIIALVVFNPLPEAIYLKNYTPTDTVINTIEFTKENWFNWLFPNAILIIILYFITGNLLTGLFNTSVSFMGFSFKMILQYLVGQIIFSFMMIYRGHLYKLLSSSTRRKRMFMNKF